MAAAQKNVDSNNGFYDENGRASTASSLLETMKELLQQNAFPRLIVFDLDNTLWTPELYQLRSMPTPNQDIRLFPDALQILQCFRELKEYCAIAAAAASETDFDSSFELAVASRTHEYEWAHALLDRFPITIQQQPSSNADAVASSSTNSAVMMRSLFPSPHLVQIQTGSKRQHFARLKAATEVPFHQMLFLDDDEYLNLAEVSAMGVLSVHTPRGVTLDLFERSLRKYAELLLLQAEEDSAWMGHVLNVKNLGIQTSKAQRR